jgi:hypothetical protein
MSDRVFLADVVALFHVAFVAFVVLGFAVMLLGDFSQWRWTRRRGFRAAHLLAVIYTLARTWLGVACPLRTLEDSLRNSVPPPATASVAIWCHPLFFRGADHRQFTFAVTLFSAIVFAEVMLSSRIRRAPIR